MNVLFVCPNLRIAGAERQWSILLTLLRQRSIRPALLTLDGRGALFEALHQRGITCACADMSRRTDIRGWGRASRFALKVKPNLVVSRGVSGHVVGEVLSARARVPHIITDHGTSRDLSWRRRLIARTWLPRMDGAVIVTEHLRPYLVELGLNERNIHVIHNGVENVDRSKASRLAARARLDVAETAVVVVLVAALRKPKRVEDFINTVHEAHKVDPRVLGVVVGTGPELTRLTHLAARTNGAVRMVGEVAQVHTVTEGADVMCLTSEVEAQPMTLLEGMALGLPIIATSLPSVSEVVMHGETGLLVPPGNVTTFTHHLLSLADDPRRRQVMGEAGRTRQRQKFAADRMVDEYTRLFQRYRAPSGGS